MAHYVIFTKVVTLTLIFIRFKKKKILGRTNQNTSHVKKSGRSPVVWPVHREQTDKQTDRQSDRQTDRQWKGTQRVHTFFLNLTDWVIYLAVQRSRTQSIGPNDSNERCAMDIIWVLFSIIIAAITENRWPWPLIVDLDLWPRRLTFDLEINLLLAWWFEEIQIAKK